jgi:hypothetical protein
MIKGQPFVAYCDWVRLTVAYLLWGWSGLFDNNLDRAATLLNHCYWRSHCRLLPPIRLRLALRAGRAVACGDFI